MVLHRFYGKPPGTTVFRAPQVGDGCLAACSATVQVIEGFSWPLRILVSPSPSCLHLVPLPQGSCMTKCSVTEKWAIVLR